VRTVRELVENRDGDILTILSPEPARQERRHRGAPRLKSLEGSYVALLDNNKPGADIILERLGVLLQERGVKTVRRWQKSLPSGPSPYVQEAAEVADVVISGLGDCGSCSSWSLRDAAEAELLGRPTVTLVSEPFSQLVRLEAQALGVAELPIFTVPHPVATRTEEELRQLADGLLDKIVGAVMES
jgi:hypothetical protein